jgi:hypothetical protein
VEALRHAPGTWALLRAGAKGFGPAQVKRAREMHPECEFVARKIAGEDGELVGAVYGRFVGEPEDAGVEPDESQAEEDDDEDGKGDARRRIADQVAREREKRRKAPNAAL